MLAPLVRSSLFINKVVYIVRASQFIAELHWLRRVEQCYNLDLPLAFDWLCERINLA